MEATRSSEARLEQVAIEILTPVFRILIYENGRVFREPIAWRHDGRSGS